MMSRSKLVNEARGAGGVSTARARGGGERGDSKAHRGEEKEDMVLELDIRLPTATKSYALIPNGLGLKRDLSKKIAVDFTMSRTNSTWGFASTLLE